MCTYIHIYIYIYIYIYTHTHITYSRILFSLSIKKHPTVGDNIYEPWGLYANWNKPVTERQVLHDATYMRYQK